MHIIHLSNPPGTLPPSCFVLARLWLWLCGTGAHFAHFARSQFDLARQFLQAPRPPGGRQPPQNRVKQRLLRGLLVDRSSDPPTSAILEEHDMRGGSRESGEEAVFRTTMAGGHGCILVVSDSCGPAP